MKTKIFLILIIVVTFSFHSYSQTGWYHLSSGTTQPLNSVYFLNSMTGFVVGDSGKILMTYNGGVNWYLRQSYSVSSLKSIQFTSAQTGYVADFVSHVIKTTDGGMNWMINFVGIATFYGQYFINNTTGYVVGDFSGTAKIFKTSDGGDNWTDISPSITGSACLYSICFSNSNIGFAVGTGGLVLRTTNGGNSWNQNYITTTGPLMSVCFVNDSTGYIAGEAIWKTTSYGVNWTLQQTVTSQLNSIKFINANTGYCVGQDIYKTTNGGNNWFTQTYQSPSFLMKSVFPVNFDTAYICGYNGKILKAIRGGNVIGVNKISSGIPNDYCLSQNYPNPFNPETIIKFSVPETKLITLKVFDILGREVETIINQTLQPGTYEVTFNGNYLSSGIYYYRLITDNYIETKRMTLVK
ncbi:MAG: T9SS type A sorting domain-containing protein [Ignavibacteria bacterium]|nr:T9SS type A sorting domain-containing protein [Ignavibacteria bacterium]